MRKITLSLLSLAFMAVVVAGLVAAFAGPASAEDKDNPYVKTRETIKKENEAIDKQYQKTLNATKGAAPASAKVDPWSNMRTDDSKAK
jgi:uncharacterized protein YxeA